MSSVLVLPAGLPTAAPIGTPKRPRGFEFEYSLLEGSTGWSTAGCMSSSAPSKPGDFSPGGKSSKSVSWPNGGSSKGDSWSNGDSSNGDSWGTSSAPSNSTGTSSSTSSCSGNSSHCEALSGLPKFWLGDACPSTCCAAICTSAISSSSHGSGSSGSKSSRSCSFSGSFFLRTSVGTGPVSSGSLTQKAPFPTSTIVKCSASWVFLTPKNLAATWPPSTCPSDSSSIARTCSIVSIESDGNGSGLLWRCKKRQLSPFLQLPRAQNMQTAGFTPSIWE
mmetsp:Transcript_3767/g.7493  ORF Transcript_3767/g.7493 Transcript_3767/m.7493 type:complete len:277 (-) Transcript_3767:237-1067(-)